MSVDRVRGLSEARLLFEGLAPAARVELGELLTTIANEALAIQEATVPVATGALKAGLSARIQLEALRARMGLLNTRRGRSKLFYGLPVDRGVRAQTVTVQRRRRVKGRLRSQTRGSRKRLADVVATYPLHIRAREGTYFVEAPDLAAIADTRLDTFWDRVAGRAGGEGG